MTGHISPSTRYTPTAPIDGIIIILIVIIIVVIVDIDIVMIAIITVIVLFISNAIAAFGWKCVTL